MEFPFFDSKNINMDIIIFEFCIVIEYKNDGTM